MSLLVVVSGSRGMQVVFQYPGHERVGVNGGGVQPVAEEGEWADVSRNTALREAVDVVWGLQASALAGLVGEILSFFLSSLFLSLSVCLLRCAWPAAVPIQVGAGGAAGRLPGHH